MSPEHEPFHDVRAGYLANREQIEAAVRRVLESGSYILGAELSRFESEFAGYLRAGGAVGVASGTAALEVALRALDVGPGDEVVVPALTAAPTAMAVCSVGATPCLVDVDEDSFTLDVGAVARALSPATRAVVAVHLYGQCADVDVLRDVVPAGVAIVEDAAQAHGAELRGRRAGVLGRVACFSFYPTKNLATFGDAGAVVSGDEELRRRMRRLADYGREGADRFEEPGTNARMDELHAAILRARLPRLEEENERRRQHAERYRRELASTAVTLPWERADGRHVYHQFVVRSARRDALRRKLGERGVGTGVHYPYALHELKALHGRARVPEHPRRAERAAREVLSLPIQPELPDERAHRVIEGIRAFGS